VVTATSPSWVAMSTGVWPDPPPVLFAALGLYALTKWVENEKIGYYTLAAFALVLSILLKLTSLYVGIPVLFLFWMKYRSRWWRMPLVWLFAALVLIPPTLWYVHAYRLFLETGNTFGILASGYSKLGSVDLYLDPRFYAKTIARVTLFDVTLLGCALAALGAMNRFDRHVQRIVLVWTGAVVIYCIAAAEGVSLGHYQYALPIVPPAAMLAGIGFENLRRSGWLPPLLTTGAAMATLLAVNAVAANYVFQTRGMNFRHLSEQKMRTGKALAQLTPSDSLIVVIDGDMNDRTPQTSMTPPEVFYFADRRGWYRAMSWLTPNTIGDLHAQGARYLAVSANGARLFRARYQDLYRQWSGQYRTMIDDDDGIVYDLGAAAASLNTR
jgi:4-amino-4-deoxy-L-arabinose transferase-like glycosyltransferase